ncbi:MAG TPA: NepR family anti-sigma factor, partial [Acetobacteraceae bacterium]
QKMMPIPAETPPAQPPPMEADLQEIIGRQLRAVYEAVENEPVPDRFVKLLAELERKKGGNA